MLQIATGKLFTRPASRENLLRGMLYTNGIFNQEPALETAAGRLFSSSSHSIRPSVLVYEFSERIEAEERGPGVLISSGVEPYLRDYSIVVSFALNCVCTPDVDLARRLTNGQRGLATNVAPQTLVRQFFDREIWCKPRDLEFLQEFVEKLIGLQRVTFLGVMRALRTYINGLHRIVDDLELAYTLLIASVESLAQDFDGHVSDWDSVDECKRNAVDNALTGATDEITQRVRKAILQVEHVALARRFREFTLTHTSSAYFRQPSSVVNETLLGRSDLSDVLRTAYQSRSKYVHQLRKLPDAVTLGHTHGETAIEDRAMHLTMHGLSRLMRNVIIEFVMRQPTISHEPYDYLRERSGVIQVRMAPQYWVGRANGDITKAGRDKLEGFLQQLASCLLDEPGAVVTDLKAVLETACEIVPQLGQRLRSPYLALHTLFNLYVPEHQSVAMPLAIEMLIHEELEKPSSEALIVKALSCETVHWSLESHRMALDTYLRRRSTVNGLRFPRLFEAAISLQLAERLRYANNVEACREILALTVENYPGHAGLLEADKNFLPTVPISWSSIMLPPLKEPPQQ